MVGFNRPNSILLLLTLCIDDILSEIIQPGDLLGLDHTEKKSSSWRTEQSIFIR